jgi:hypothetical protein
MNGEWMLGKNTVPFSCVIGTDIETIFRNYEIDTVASLPTVPFRVAHSFGLKFKKN